MSNLPDTLIPEGVPSAAPVKSAAPVLSSAQKKVMSLITDPDPEADKRKKLIASGVGVFVILVVAGTIYYYMNKKSEKGN